MVSSIISPKLKVLAKDLTQEPPRSPRETLAGYIILPRLLDKCRAHLNGTAGAYNFGRFMDHLFLDFAGIEAEQFKAFVATGASDEEVAVWVQQQACQKERLEIVKWNNQIRYATLKELPEFVQEFMEGYIEEHVPKHRPVYYVFDIFDLEEGRL